MELVLCSYARKAERLSARNPYLVARWEPEREPVGQ